MADKSSLNLRIQPELKEKAQILAEEDGRSLSNWIKKLIAQQIEESEQGNAADLGVGQTSAQAKDRAAATFNSADPSRGVKLPAGSQAHDLH